MLDPSGRVLIRKRVPTPAGDYEGTVSAVVELVREVEACAGGQGTVGIGTPGAISPFSGLLHNSTSVALNGRPLDRDLETALGRPVRLANDADCFALAEAVTGAGVGAGTVFGVILGTGVGGGLVINRPPRWAPTGSPANGVTTPNPERRWAGLLLREDRLRGDLPVRSGGGHGVPAIRRDRTDGPSRSWVELVGTRSPPQCPIATPPVWRGRWRW